MKWITLKEYASRNGEDLSSVRSLAWRGRFPAKTLKRRKVAGRCVLIEVLEGTPWPARKKTKKGV